MFEMIGVVAITGIAVSVYSIWYWNRIEDRRESASNGLIQVMELLERVFTSEHIPASHGIDHARKVMIHTRRAVAAMQDMITDNEKLAVLLAALLHDADDRKYFPANTNCENVRTIVRAIYPGNVGLESLVVQMIGYVSTSANGNTIPAEAVLKPWLLYPRWSDRLEAGGWTGVVRAWDYTIETHGLLFTENTPRATSEDELWAIATPERFSEYKGNSASMMDHYYDKLLHICNFATDNQYLRDQARNRSIPLIHVCLQFGRSGELYTGLLEYARDQISRE